MPVFTWGQKVKGVSGPWGEVGRSKRSVGSFLLHVHRCGRSEETPEGIYWLGLSVTQRELLSGRQVLANRTLHS